MPSTALKSVNDALAKAFAEFEKYETLNERYMQVFWRSYRALPEELRNELKKHPSLYCLNENIYPSKSDYSSIVDYYDDIYFEENEKGNKYKSELNFRLARIVSSINLFYNGEVEYKLPEAVYEAVFSADDPHEFAKIMGSELGFK